MHIITKEEHTRLVLERKESERKNLAEQARIQELNRTRALEKKYDEQAKILAEKFTQCLIKQLSDGVEIPQILWQHGEYEEVVINKVEMILFGTFTSKGYQISSYHGSSEPDDFSDTEYRQASLRLL